MVDRRVDWATLEREWVASWKQKLAPLPVNWLERERFWEEFESRCVPVGRTMDRNVYFPIDLSGLRSRIPVCPVFSPLEEDFPGPVERWYGEAKGHLFLVTHYYLAPSGSDHTMVRVEDNDLAESEVIAVLADLRALDPYS